MISKDISVLKDGIIFKFLEEITNKAFENKTDWGFMVNDRTNDPKQPRWGEILVVGPTVEHVKVGDYVLIENLQWTSALHYKGDKFWKTNESRVMLVSETRPKEFC